ncbi:MAG: DNA alkylation repair protein [Gemmatimonadetes bacterium]|nr:DNA alkylation repair protein [Gemmatimonadota bacterium]MYC90485.1 DNA alkylation repair protein [Gemmatimonadota bacterium]
MGSALIGDLQRRLDEVADPATKAWFENYLKQAISYRGVRTAAVAGIVAAWRSAHELHRLSNRDQLGLAAALIRQDHAEDKFAGTLYIQKYLLRRVDAEAILTTAEDLFARGAFFDWSTSDWFSVRVLGPLIKRHGSRAAERIAGWRGTTDLWQRRSSIVPFRAVVRQEAYHALIEGTIATLVKERERFIQTGIGWVISDLSKAHPTRAAALVERHFDDLSAEVIRRHTRHLPEHGDYKARRSAKATLSRQRGAN